MCLTEVVTPEHLHATIVEAKTLLQVVDSKLNSTMFVLKLTTLLEFVVI